MKDKRNLISLIIYFLVVLAFIIGIFIVKIDNNNYYVPSERSKHEGTWLTWPHKYASNYEKYGPGDVTASEYASLIEPVWINITKELYLAEQVHIIAYNNEEEQRIRQILISNGIDDTKIDFIIYETNDIWVRDSGPIFGIKNDNKLVILNFKFDGYGEKFPEVGYKKDALLKEYIASNKKHDIVNINMVLEGGSVEIDGAGTLIASKSSVISDNRNWDITIKKVEKKLKKYYGVSNIIWIDGLLDEDITDGHIDACAKFSDENTLVTLSKEDFLYYCTNNENDYEVIKNAKNVNDKKYNIVEIPLTKNIIESIEDYGNYINYYVGNEVVLVPIYNDPNDSIAIAIIEELYPSRRVVGIDSSNLIKFGGMIHCVTQQQPLIINN